LQPMVGSLHTSTASVTGALTTSVLAGAAMAIPVGRWLDRHGGRLLMTFGSIAATVLVVAWAHVRTVGQLYLVFVGIGITAAMVLYEPALAVVVSWFDPPRRTTAVLGVIVVAGFASTIFMPLTGALLDRYGWRTALLILAALHGALTIPLHAVAVRKPSRPAVPQRPPTRHDRAVAVRTVLRDRRFWWLGTAFVAHGAATSTMAVHLVGFLVYKGHPATFAATVAGLLGVLSVTGRLLLAGVRGRLSLTAVVAAVFTVQAVAALALPIVGRSRVGATLAVVAFGIGFGVVSLVKPTTVADRYGTTDYATIAGLLATPITLARATTPLAAAGLLATAGGYGAVLVAIGAACLLAAIGITARASAPPPKSHGFAASEEQPGEDEGGGPASGAQRMHERTMPAHCHP
jgi:MFS family permease